jgi:hypothetical protein
MIFSVLVVSPVSPTTVPVHAAFSTSYCLLCTDIYLAGDQYGVVLKPEHDPALNRLI